MLISEYLFLYGLDENSKKNEMKNLRILLAGAMLFDLEQKGLIVIHPTESIIIGPIVELKNPKLTNNVVLDEAIREISSKKRDFPVSYWLSKFRNKKHERLVIENLIHSKNIQQVGKKFEILRSEIKDEMNNSFVQIILKDHEPEEKFRLLLMISCLRSVNWKLLPNEINYKDTTIKERLREFQEMMVKDKVGFYIAMQVPKTTYKVGGSITYRF